MAAFKEIGFVAAIAAARVVINFGVGGDIGGGSEAVVGGKDDEGVFREAVFFERGDEDADVGIDLRDEIAVGGGAGFSVELARGQNRGVRAPGQWDRGRRVCRRGRRRASVK